MYLMSVLLDVTFSSFNISLTSAGDDDFRNSASLFSKFSVIDSKFVML